MLGVSTDTDAYHDTCSVESNQLKAEETHPVSKDEIDPGWTGMHDPEVGEMLNNEVDGDH